MSESQEPQGAEALLTSTPSSSTKSSPTAASQLPSESPIKSPSKLATLFHRVIVILERTEGRNQDKFENVPLNATVRIEHNRFTVERIPEDDSENKDFWSYDFCDLTSLQIEKTSVTFKAIGGTITLRFRKLTLRKNGIERFVRMILPLIPDHVFVQGRDLVQNDKRYYPSISSKEAL